MNGLGIEVKAAALFIALSVIPLSAAGYLLTEQSMNELNDKSIEGLTDVVRGKAMLYSEELINFKEDAEALSEYISSTWNKSYSDVANYSYIWVSPNGTGYDATTTSLTSTANLQKLTPSALGLTFPVRFNYSWSEQLPRLKSGSDIVLPDSLREPEKNTALTKSVSTNLAIKPPDAPWWMDYSIGAMTFSASYSRSENRKPLAPLSLNENTSLSHRYGLSFGKRKEQKLPLTGFIGDSLPEWLTLDLYYLPTQIDFNTSVSERHTLNINKYYTITDTRTRTLNHTTTFGTQPFNSLSQTTTLSMTRNIIDPNTIQISNPVIIGIPLTKEIKNNVTYKPSFISFLTQNSSILRWL